MNTESWKDIVAKEVEVEEEVVLEPLPDMVAKELEAGRSIVVYRSQKENPEIKDYVKYDVSNEEEYRNLKY